MVGFPPPDSSGRHHSRLLVCTSPLGFHHISFIIAVQLLWDMGLRHCFRRTSLSVVEVRWNQCGRTSKLEFSSNTDEILSYEICASTSARRVALFVRMGSNFKDVRKTVILGIWVYEICCILTTALREYPLAHSRLMDRSLHPLAENVITVTSFRHRFYLLPTVDQSVLLRLRV